MSVVIKGLKKPDHCFECPCVINLFYCKACGGRSIFNFDTTTFTKDSINIRRPKWCPMEEIDDV